MTSSPEELRPEEPRREDGYEREDARGSAVIKAGLALALVTGATFLISGLLDQRWTREAERKEDEPHPMAGARRPPTAALLQADPEQLIMAYKEQQSELTHSYGWIDRDAGVVRIPVERAMELLLARDDAAGAAEEAR